MVWQLPYKRDQFDEPIAGSATKEAVRAARIEHGLSAEFPMNFPASVDRVSAVLPDIESMI